MITSTYWNVIKVFVNLQIHSKIFHFATITEFFPRFPKTSEDFWRFPKIFKNFQNFGNLLECWFLHSPVLFPKFSKEFPNIQQRRHKPLLPVTGRPHIYCPVGSIPKPYSPIRKRYQPLIHTQYMRTNTNTWKHENIYTRTCTSTHHQIYI